MSAKQLSMRKIREVLGLKWAVGMSNREIAANCGVSRPTVSEYLRRSESAGLSWPLRADMSDARFERLLFPPPPDFPASAQGVPDFAEVHRQLKVKRSRLTNSARIAQACLAPSIFLSRK